MEIRLIVDWNINGKNLCTHQIKLDSMTVKTTMSMIYTVMMPLDAYMGHVL